MNSNNQSGFYSTLLNSFGRVERLLTSQMLLLKFPLVYLLSNSYPRSTGGFLFLTSTYCYEHFQIYRKVERLVNSHVSIYELPLGVVTNDNKLCGFKEHKWIKLSGGQMSEVSLRRLKSRSQQVVFPLEVLGEDLFLAFSNFQRMHSFVGLWTHRFSDLCFCVHITFSVSGLPLSLFKDSLITLGPPGQSRLMFSCQDS